MNQNLEKKILELKNEIQNSSEYKKFIELDKKLNSNEKVMKLAYAKDMASIKFEDALKHFGESSKEASEAQKELYKVKLELDTHPLVKEYNEQYKKIRKIYDKINEEIFFKFN